MKGLKGITKIAALGVAVIFGASTFGAAVDLGDYPAPFVEDGIVESQLVLGEKAAVIDVIGAVNIAASFSAAGGEGTVVIEGEEGLVVNAVAFDERELTGWNSTDGNVDDFPAKDEYRILLFDEDDSVWNHFVGYGEDDIEENLDFRVHAYEDSDSVPVVYAKMGYNITFGDDDVQEEIDDFVKDAEAGDEFKYRIELLGKVYYVVADWDDDSKKFDNETLQLANVNLHKKVADEVALGPYGYEGYTLVIEEIYEAGSAGLDGYVTFSLLDEDGLIVDTETIEEGKNAKLRDRGADIDVRVYLENVFFSAQTSEYTARFSLESGKMDVGDWLDSDKIWNLTALVVNKTAETIHIEVALNSDDDKWEQEGKVERETADIVKIYEGNQISMLGYAAVGFTGLTQQKFGNFDIRQTTSSATTAGVDRVVLEFDAGIKNVEFGNERFRGTSATLEYNGTDDNTWFVYAMSGADKDKFDDFKLGTDEINFAVGDAKYTFGFNGELGSNATFYLEADVDNDGSNDRTFTIELDNDPVDGYWDETYIYDTPGNIYRSEHKSDEGREVVSYNRETRIAKFALPDDIVRYRVYAGKDVLATEAGKVTVGVGDVVPDGKIVSVGGSALPVGLAIMDTELATPEAVKTANYIVIGGPCANTAAAALLGNPENCAEGFEPGKAMIKLFEFEDSYALLVAGYEGADTVLATEVLADFASFADDFAGKTEVEISGATLSDVTVN